MNARSWIPVAMICAVAMSANSQEARWHSMSNTTGMNGPVRSAVAWDPDGPGPLAPLAVMGGEFTAAVDVLARNVAAWDGQKWHALGEGLDGAVHALTVWDGRLVAGGDFRTAGHQPTEGLAMWDGDRWSPIAGLAAGAIVYGLTEHEGELIAAGLFATAGGMVVNSIAAFRAGGWRPLGAGLNNGVLRVGVHEGRLYAGGSSLQSAGQGLGSLAIWNGATWTSMGITFGTVRAIRSIDGLLFVGGGSLTVPQTSGGVLVHDGTSWSRLGPPVHYIRSPGVSDIHKFGGEIWVTGFFSETPWTWHTVGTAVWNGVDWYSPGGNVHFPAHAMVEREGELLVGGDFLRVDNYSSQFVARWTGEQWLPTGLGTNTYLSVLTDFGGELIAGGGFRGIAGFPIDGVARWNGNTWRPMGNVIRSASNSEITVVNAITTWQSSLLVGGRFRLEDDDETVFLALWDGRTWSAFQPQPPGRVISLLVRGDEVIACAESAPNSGRWGPFHWNGSTWTATRGDVSQPFSAMIEFQGDVIAGFSANNIAGCARWNGIEWVQMGSSLRNSGNMAAPAQAFAIYRGDLYAGGWFTRIGSMPSAPLVRWNGVDWESVALPNGSTSVHALLTHEDRLVVACLAPRIIGLERQISLLAFDGDQWEDLGGVSRGTVAIPMPSVETLHSWRGDVYISGDFTVAGGNLVSARIARHGFDVCYPDCDTSTGPGVLDIFDFLCFGNRFSAGDPYACDCDVSTGPGVCDIFDFLCFGNAFNAGCP